MALRPLVSESPDVDSNSSSLTHWLGDFLVFQIYHLQNRNDNTQYCMIEVQRVPNTLVIPIHPRFFGWLYGRTKKRRHKWSGGGYHRSLDLQISWTQAPRLCFDPLSSPLFLLNSLHPEPPFIDNSLLWQSLLMAPQFGGIMTPWLKST
jgi:hypothetical protein